MNSKILVIDDDIVIQEVIKRILRPKQIKLQNLANDLFDEKTSEKTQISYQIDCASQGEEGLKLVIHADKTNTPYALAFIDMRMPPGWDGIKTAQEIRKFDPNLQIVFVTAASDKNTDDINEQLEGSNKVSFIKKPFEPDDILSIAELMTKGHKREKA